MAIETALSSVFPIGSRRNELGRLEVGGCDTIELAKEFGTPAYVVCEEDLRVRAQAFKRAGAGANLEVVFASKAFPCTAVLSIFASEGLWCEVASEGELHLALRAGFPASRVLLHGNAKSSSELEYALAAGVALIVIDNFDEIDVLEALLRTRGNSDSPQHVLIRVTPDVRGQTHEKISTGQANSKFGFSIGEAQKAAQRLGEVRGLRLIGLHAHIGSQLLELSPFRREVEQIAKVAGSLGGCEVWDLGGGLGVRYLEQQPSPPGIAEYVETLLEAARNHDEAAPEGLPTGNETPERRILIEPGRSLTANGCVTLYTVQSVKRNASVWVAVDGGMSDNLRPMLYGAHYEARLADRLDGGVRCVLAGKHCESGDVIVADALLPNPKRGDVVVTPGTGAYCYAMSNNYNGALRAPVILCSRGDARLVVRRDTLDDLTARDVH